MGDEWIDPREWYNDRILETFIGSDQIDAHGEKISSETYEKVMPWLNKYGYYNYMHDDGGMPIGQFLGYRWRTDPEDGLTKPEMRVGIHDSENSQNPYHDKIWERIKEYGTRAGSSIHGKKLAKTPHYDKDGQYDELGDITAWAVAWACDDPANPGAVVTNINDMAKMSEKGCTMCKECSKKIGSCSTTSPGAGVIEKTDEGEKTMEPNVEGQPAPAEGGGEPNLDEVVAQLAERIEKLYSMFEEMNKEVEPTDATEEAPTVEGDIEKTGDDTENPGPNADGGEETDKDTELIKALAKRVDALEKSKTSLSDMEKEWEKLQKNRGVASLKKREEAMDGRKAQLKKILSGE